MNLKTQLEEMTIQRNYHENATTCLQKEMEFCRKLLRAKDNELADKNTKIKDQAEQIHWLKQLNQTLTRKIPNYAGA